MCKKVYHLGSGNPDLTLKAQQGIITANAD
jgi:hypothetical protein